MFPECLLEPVINGDRIVFGLRLANDRDTGDHDSSKQPGHSFPSATRISRPWLRNREEEESLELRREKKRGEISVYLRRLCQC